MGRGIHRFVIRLRPGVVKVRAQSASRSGQAFTTGSTEVVVADTRKSSTKAAISAAISSFYPKEA